jgi:hypothetical protein
MWGSVIAGGHTRPDPRSQRTKNEERRTASPRQSLTIVKLALSSPNPKPAFTPQIRPMFVVISARVETFSMNDNRRTSFRAPSLSEREATLKVGNQSLRVQIADESAGGLCVRSGETPDFAAGEQAHLITDDGDRLFVQVVHLQSAGLAVRIGLKRMHEDRAPRRRSTSPLMLLIGLTLGLWAGMFVPVPAILRTIFGG